MLQVWLLMCDLLLIYSGIKTKEGKAAQLTIFYGGQVIVFDDFPADKAKELMSFASKGNPQSQNSSASAYTFAQTQPSFPSTPIPANVVNNPIQEHPQPQSRPVVCGIVSRFWIF